MKRRDFLKSMGAAPVAAVAPSVQSSAKENRDVVRVLGNLVDFKEMKIIMAEETDILEFHRAVSDASDTYFSAVDIMDMNMTSPTYRNTDFIFTLGQGWSIENPVLLNNGCLIGLTDCYKFLAYEENAEYFLEDHLGVSRQVVPTAEGFVTLPVRIVPMRGETLMAYKIIDRGIGKELQGYSYQPDAYIVLPM